MTRYREFSEPVSRVEIDLDIVKQNCRTLARSAGRPVLAVLKADAYGHGAVEVARMLENEASCERLMVARLEEALQLRHAGIEAPISVLQCHPASQTEVGRRELASAMIENELLAVVSSVEDLRCWSELSGDLGSDRLLDLELELDTGMARAGLARGELAMALLLLERADGARLRGFLSHLAESDVADSEVTRRQLADFQDASREVRAWSRSHGVPEPQLHLANSCGVLSDECLGLGASARVGGALFGLDLGRSEDETATRRPRLEPAMRVQSRLVAVRHLRRGDAVGYNQIWSAPSDRPVGLVPVGYADGFPRSAGGGRVLVGSSGYVAKIVGRVSMDSVVVDLEGVADAAVSVGQPVCILGSAGGEMISVDELALEAGTISYEITCRFGARLPRSFVSTQSESLSPRGTRARTRDSPGR